MAPVNSLIHRYELLLRASPPQPLPGRVGVKRYDMPLRQSTLSFARGQTTPTATTRKSSRNTPPSKQITPPAEDLDEDTIVVKIPDEPATEEHGDFPLPTPSESVTDNSSHSSETPKAQSPVKSRSKRVSETKRSPNDTMLLPVPSSSKLDSGLSEKLRNISGDTLVADALTSQTSLVKDGIDKLDLRWNIDGESGGAEKEQQVVEEEEDSDAGKTGTVAVEEQAESSTKRKGTKRVKIDEKNQKREEGKKSAEQSVTRRSSRASMLVTKAAEVVSEITASVLGKRSRGKEQEPRTSTPTPTAVKSDSPHIAKKAKPSAKNEVTERHDDGVSLAATSRALKSRAPKDKKWLISGLYAGQSRTFDPTKSEGQNKRKSNGAAIPSVPVEENSVLPLPMFAGSRLLEVGRDFHLPFDVFSPLPPGQPKPDEWRRVNKNVFVGDAAAEWRTNKFSETSTCLCRPENGCDSDCMNRFMYYECDSRNCNLSEEQCGNRAFEGLRKRVKAGGQYNVGVEVLRTVDRGYGVRACRTFEPNQIIVEYTGEIINQEECESRMHGLYKDNECYYLMAFDQNMIIDATRGSIARFVNHSCAPNCRMEKWTVGGKPRMALFASDHGIMTGEELTYDYNFDPYSQKNVQVCRCGADNCRGVLGPKPKEVPKKEKESALAGAKRKIAEVIEEGKEMMTGNKKRKMAEDTRKKLPKGWVYLPAEEKPKATKARKKTESEEPAKDNDDATAKGSLSRRPSKLRRMVSTKSSKSQKSTKSAKSSKSTRTIKSISSSIRNGSSKNKKQSKRVVSTNSTSSGTALIKASTSTLAENDNDEGETNGNEAGVEAEVATEEWEDTVEDITIANADADANADVDVGVLRSKSKGSSKSASSVAALKAKAGSIKGRVGRSLRRG